MRSEPGFFDVDERLMELSAKGDDLERMKAIVDGVSQQLGMEPAESAPRKAASR